MPPSPVRLHRLFLDANVLFAACRQEGRARALLKLAARAEVLLLTSPHALEEARRNLEAKRPEALGCLQRIRERARMVPEAPMALVRKALAEGLPPKDAPILAAAWSAGAEALVTGDRRHFGPLMGRKVRGLWVVSLAEALAGVMDLLEGKG